MRLQFLGAAQTVTGSKYLLSDSSTQVLVDCGLFQGLKIWRLKNWEPLSIDLSQLDAIVLTHAHLDHCGYIPVLYKAGYRGPIYCTPATRDLCRILLIDSGYLQEEEARFANHKGFSKHKPALPLYTAEDAEECLQLFRAVEWKTPLVIKDLTFRFFPAGHLLGAASIHVQGPESSIVFSGDIGRDEDPILRPPVPIPSADTVVMESTYGDRLHPVTDPEQELARIINLTVARKGTVVIPSFAVGRAQLILYYLKRLRDSGAIPDVPIYLNSPMAKAVNETFKAYAGEHKLSAVQAEQVCLTAHAVGSVDESIALNNDPTPKIIISASGMASGGRVLHHLKTYAPNPRSAIVFVGFQAPGTRGEALVNGATEIKIHGQYWPINADVFHLGSLSAHADAAELLKWLTQLKPTPNRLFISHGEPRAADALRLRIKETLGLEPELPEMGTSFELKPSSVRSKSG